MFARVRAQQRGMHKAEGQTGREGPRKLGKLGKLGKPRRPRKLAARTLQPAQAGVFDLRGVVAAQQDVGVRSAHERGARQRGRRERQILLGFVARMMLSRDEAPHALNF